MLRLLIAFLGCSLALGASAAVSSNGRIKIKDIAEIVKNDPEQNILEVKVADGRIFRLKVSPEKREDIVNRVQGYEIASTEAVPAPATIKPLKTSDTSKAAGETTAKADEAKEEKSPWGVGLLYIPSARLETLTEGEASIGNYFQLGISYKINDKWRVSLSPTAFMAYDQDSGSTDHSIGDIQLRISRGKFATLGGFDIRGSARYYIPTGESSRDAESNGILRGDLGASRGFGDFSLSSSFSTRYYLQSNRSNTDFDDFGRITNNPTGTRSLRLISSVSGGYDITKKLGVGQAFRIDHGWLYDDPGVGVEEGDTRTVMTLETSVSVDHLSFVSLVFFLEQNHNLSADDSSFSLWNSEELTAGLVAFFPLK